MATDGTSPAAPGRGQHQMEIPDGGLCDHCRHCKPVVSPRGSVFRRCLLHERDPRFAKYPRVPVTNCGGYRKAVEEKAP